MAQFDSYLFELLYWGTLGLALWAFVDSLIRPSAGYVAHGKLSKPAWVAITAVAAVVIYWGGPLGILGLAAVIASIVYLVDVRPAVRGLTRGNGW